MTATTVSRRIPIRLEPLPGEAFDGWLDAYAQRLRISTVELGDALDVPRSLLRLRGAKLALASRPPDPERIAAHACGIDPAQVEALWLGLARYARVVAERLGANGLMRATRPLAWSRFCPACLSESARWLAAWRLPWYLVCPTHQTVLASCCPRCGGAQRDRGIRIDHVEGLTTRCSRPQGDATGRRDQRCGHDLTTDASGAPAPPALIALQAELSAVDPELSHSDAERLVDQLVDVLAVATHVGLDPRAIAGGRLNATSVLAGPLAEAHRVLADPTGARLRALTNTDRQPIPFPLPGSWRAARPGLAAVLLGHRDPRLRPADRVRYRSMTGAGRRPEGAAVSIRLRAIPLALWPDWSIRLRPRGIESNNFRISGAAALCVPGATATLREIAGHWPATHLSVNLSRLLSVIAADPHGTAILGALCALTDELDRDGAPIDYDRRRTLANQIALLDADAWAAASRAGGTPTGGTFKLRSARLWLWETLTGGRAEQAPPSLRPQSPSDVDRYQQFELLLPGDTARRLLNRARGLLDAHGCQDEPLTWSPRGAGIAIDKLPCPDPDAINAQRAHALLAQPITPGDAAEQLGITLGHLRYFIRKHPAENPRRPTSDRPPRLRLARRATPDELRELVNQGHTLRGIAAHYGVGRDTVRDELLAHGIQIPQVRGRRPAVEREWLREQYLVKQRTMPEIAAETTASRTTIARLIHEHAIPVRGRGTPSHQQSLTAGSGFPEPLASAVRDPYGTDRVRRFQVAARTRSLSVAATRLGVGGSVLTDQVARLERACGGELIQRTTPDHRPQQPTALGKTLLAQADRLLGTHPDAPPELPEPLSTVLAAHRGDRMLAKFAAAATCSTLAHGATALDIDPASLQRTIRRLEAALGEPVLTDHRRTAPLHLTPIGRRLLHQAGQHQP